jgi:hypothetical protein
MAACGGRVWWPGAVAWTGILAHSPISTFISIDYAPKHPGVRAVTYRNVLVCVEILMLLGLIGEAGTVT